LAKELQQNGAVAGDWRLLLKGTFAGNAGDDAGDAGDDAEQAASDASMGKGDGNEDDVTSD
ncbi:hypothetical protein A2U01_0111786, partial [Trifolium medium]|nr:hypothetical protein [Trifolium medium]